MSLDAYKLFYSHSITKGLNILGPAKRYILRGTPRNYAITGAQPSAGLSEEIYLSEGFSEASAGVSSRVLWGSAGAPGIFQG